MTVSLSQLLEKSFQIAWEYLERTGELGDATDASRFLGNTIETMIRRGQRSRLALSNRTFARLSTSSIDRRNGVRGGGVLVRLRLSCRYRTCKNRNHEMSVTESDLVERMANKHSVSPAAVEVVLAALRSGGGRMAQFSHADFGGMSQWSPGMSMVGDMFNTQLKAKLDALCSDIAAHLNALPAAAGSRSAPEEVSYRSTSGS
jgi:hypothetical protein